MLYRRVGAKTRPEHERAGRLSRCYNRGALLGNDRLGYDFLGFSLSLLLP